MDELQLKVNQIKKYPRTEAINEANIEEVMNIESFMKSDEDELKWYVEGVLPEQSASILGGMQGLGKTWLMLDLAIELARGGGSWLNKLQVNPASVLYVDEESSNRLLRYRLKKLINAKGLKIKDLQLHLSVGHNFNFSNPESVEKFKRLLDKVKPSVVFIDSLVRIHRGEENSSTEMSGVFKTVKNLIRQFNCSFLFADHEGKAAYHYDPKVPEKEPSSNDLRGSNEKAAFVDTVLSLKRKDGELYLYHTKSRHAEAIAPFLIKIEDLDEAKTKLAVRGY
jgi:RecA-family ATPase